MKTLQQILERNKNASKNGMFGKDACKESIKDNIAIDAKYGKTTSLYELLESYVKRANESVFFNEIMVVACWELINGIE